MNKLSPQTPLEAAVAEWLTIRAADYNDGIAGVMRDLNYGGCASGYVSGLVYNADAEAFYMQHAAEIGRILYDVLDDTGCSATELITDWEEADPLALETPNRVKLAWLGFEEAARRLASRAGIDE